VPQNSTLIPEGILQSPARQSGHERRDIHAIRPNYRGSRRVLTVVVSGRVYKDVRFVFNDCVLHFIGHKPDISLAGGADTREEINPLV
jgi:hypothetical protein